MPRHAIDQHLHKGAAANRLDHLQLHVSDTAASLEFYAALGFRITEYATIDGSPDGSVLGAFLSRKGDVADVVVALNHGPRLHHFSWMVHDATFKLTHAADVASGLGMREAVEYGPARHGLAPQQFLYLRDPDGHRTELVNTSYQFIDAELEPTLWALVDPKAIVTWGIGPGEGWLQEASRFRGVSVEPPSEIVEV
jgi:catechol 2,3-dioxygenase